ncbi:MAG: response regulator [Candidatus Brocadiae bacterium]|nr:response regulator [Candidatus Brocadiia bacterium]
MKKILIVDDDFDIVDAVKMVLENHGFHVVSHKNTKNAVEKIKAESPDLLILDVMFPENVCGGFEIAQDVRKEESLKQLPILIFSAINEQFKLGFMRFSQETVSDSLAEINDFLEKPFECDLLLEKIHKLLGKKSCC